MTKSTRGVSRVTFDTLLPAATALHAYGRAIKPKLLAATWSTKPLDNTWVSNLDKEAGEKAAELTDKVLPGTYVVDEEKDETHTFDFSGPCRVIDGLDGSENAKDGRKLKGVTFSVSVTTWIDDGIPIASVIVQPMYDRCIAMIKGHGIRIRNGDNEWKLLRDYPPSRRHRVVDLVVSSDEKLKAIHASKIATFQKHFGKGPNCPTVHAGVRVAIKQSDGSLNSARGKVWDFAPGVLGMHEVSGYMRRLSGKPIRFSRVNMDAHRDPIIMARTAALADEMCRVWDKTLT